MALTPLERKMAYGTAYRKARTALLASNPRCHWCGEPATTADHEPPIEVAGLHMNLVPACAPCNFGRHGKTPKPFNVEPSRQW